MELNWTVPGSSFSHWRFLNSQKKDRNNAMYTHHKNAGRKKVQYPPVETPSIFAFTLVLVKTCFIAIKNDKKYTTHNAKW